jgi:TRAP-type transport system periplasmic protein
MDRRQALISGFAGAAALASPAYIGRASAQTVTLKLGHLANEQNVWHKAALKLAEEAKALSNGRLAIQVFPNDSLGREMDIINGMQLGTQDMLITGESLQNWAPNAALLAVPYAMTSLEQMDRVAGGAIGQKIAAEVVERAGLRLRVPNVPLFVAVWSALGARPTPMAFGEVFTSLQNGTIDGQENPLSLIKSANFNEVQKFVNKTEHVRSWIYVAISERRFQSLSADDRNALTEAAKRAQAFERTLFLEDEKSLEAELKAKGMTFVDSDQKEFAAKAKDAAINGIRPEAKALLQELLAAAG